MPKKKNPVYANCCKCQRRIKFVETRVCQTNYAWKDRACKDTISCKIHVKKRHLYELKNRISYHEEKIYSLRREQTAVKGAITKLKKQDKQ